MSKRLLINYLFVFVEVGPEGNKLSGGQKQRLAICRALYQDCDIYLFDDIFSSVDVHVCEGLFKKLILQLLKNKKKTVLMTISQYNFLKYADHVILLRDGKIISDEAERSEYIGESERVFVASLSKSLNEAKERRLLGLLPQEEELCNQKSQKKDEVAIEKTQEEEEEFRDEGGVRSTTLKAYIQAIGLLLFAATLFSVLMMQITKNIIDFWLKDQLSQSNFDAGHFNTYLIGLTILNLIVTGVRSVLQVASTLVSCQKMFGLLNKKVLYANMKFFDQNPIGRILNRYSQDVSQIDDYLPWCFGVFFDRIAVCTGLAGGVAYQFPWLTIG